MTTSQIMMRLREIEGHLDNVYVRLSRRSTTHLDRAQHLLCELIDEMLADEQRAHTAHAMGELPFDGQRVKP